MHDLIRKMSKINYIVFKNEVFGRYLVASRDIKQGETIITESPVLIGPPIAGRLVCFNCCRNIEAAFIYCRGCNAAIICKGHCSGNFHTKKECDILTSKNIKGSDLLENPQIIFPLRCLLLKITNPETWNAIMELESHIEVRRNTAIWRRHQVAVVDILKKMNLLDHEYLKEELVQRICGTFDVNTFEVRFPQSSMCLTNPEEQCLRGLYLNAALMAHDCTGNTFLSVDDDFVLTVKASVNIQKNSPIFFNYSNILQGTVDRKQHLKEGKYFDCTCKRCIDPTELNSEVSSLKCHKCPQGFARMKEPRNSKSDWECSHCKKTFKHSLVNIILEEGRRLIKETGDSNINTLEKLHKKLLKTFHPNHFLILEMQQNMVGMYSCLPPNVENLTKKILICQKLLEVFAIVEPGLSRMRGMTLYQMQSAMVDLAHKSLQRKLITLEELFFKLKDADKALNESLKCLLQEPVKSPEGKIAHMALNELKMLRASISNIQEDLLSKPEQKIIDKLNIRNLDGTNNEESETSDNVVKLKRNKKNKKYKLQKNVDKTCS